MATVTTNIVPPEHVAFYSGPNGEMGAYDDRSGLPVTQDEQGNYITTVSQQADAAYAEAYSKSAQSTDTTYDPLQGHKVSDYAEDPVDQAYKKIANSIESIFKYVPIAIAVLVVIAVLVTAKEVKQIL